MGCMIDVVAKWPDLFNGLTPEQVWSVQQACAAGQHEGWAPEWEDVADLAARARGELSSEELLIRARARAAGVLLA